MRRAFCLASILVSSLSCGGNDTGPSSTPTDATITITAAGVNPQSATITVGGRVTFINSDTAPHQPSSDPHPLHTECPGLNLPLLNPGQQATSAALTTRRTCGFHDHLNDTIASLNGTITVQ